MTSNVNVYVQRVTPKIATEWLESRQYDYQRPINKRRVQQYARQMTDRQWLISDIKFAIVGGEKKLINGNHRLHAVVESRTIQTFTITEIVCTPQEAADHYAKTDRGGARTTVDTFRTLEAEQVLGINRKQVNAAGAAVKTILADFVSHNRGDVPDYRLWQEMLVYKYQIRDYFQVFVGATGDIRSAWLRSPVAALGIVVLHYRPKMATDYLRGVAFDDGLHIGDPRKLAHRHLITTTMASSSQSRLKRITHNYHSRYLANTWNAYCEGRTLTSTNVRNELAPIRIVGTPWS